MTRFSAGVEMSQPAAPRVPAYFDAFLNAVRGGARIDHVHLGHWDRPETATGSPADFEAAQARMAEKLLSLADVQPGQHILDAGCGLGGLARLVDAKVSPVSLIGLNIDPRQLAVCDGIKARADNRLDWVAADACRLTFADNVFDWVFCVEAIFHFKTRRRFLAEAFRVLRPHGSLVLGDILLQRPGTDGALPVAAIEDTLETELGPWPDKWFSLAELRSCSLDCGFSIETEIDATANTLPSYLTIAPASSTRLTGPAVMRMLHEQGDLTYIYLRLAKPA
jgi:MPBQ/MSBQ methyltransferase